MSAVRALLTLALLVLAFAPAAGAQEPEPTPPPGCERGPGTDADYAYCPDEECREEGTDADYVYGCPQYSVPGRGGGGGDEPRTVAARPLPAQTLPVTGAESLFVAGAGLGLLLAGAGLRLRLRHR